MTDADRAQDVVELLQGQHDLVRQLLRTIDEASGADRSGPFTELLHQLEAHEVAEESVVYPALRTLGSEAAAVADQRIAEEKEAEKAIADLQTKNSATDEFAQAFKKFRDAVEKHASAEESQVFPLLSSDFAADMRRELGSSLLRAEAQHSA